MGETSATAEKKAKSKGIVIPINQEGLEHDEQPGEEENLSASYRRTLRAMFLVFLATAVVTVIVIVSKYPEWETPSVSAVEDMSEPAAEDTGSEPAPLSSETAPAVGPVSAAEPADEMAGQTETESAPTSAGKNSDPEAIFPLGINTATSEELQQIPGIGPVMAEKIILYREQIGTFTDFDDLLPIDGIGQKTVEKLTEYCYID